MRGAVFSITRTADELSVVCESKYVPGSVKSEKGWRCFKLEGPFPFTMTGVLASVLEPLAKARVSIFAVSTYDTDYVMVKEKQLGKAEKALRAAGHNGSSFPLNEPRARGRARLHQMFVPQAISGVASSNLRVYSCAGRAVICSAAPVSTILPALMTAMRVAR